MISLYFTDKVTRVRTTRDKWGEVDTTSYVVYSARVNLTSKQVRNQGGELEVAHAEVMLDSAADIQLNDRLVLSENESPDPKDERDIISIHTPKDWADRYQTVFVK